MPGGAETFHIPIGATREASPGFELKLDGEVVVSARLLPGFDQRRVEIAAEKRGWQEIIDLLAELFGLCPHAHALAYILGVERLAGLEVPPRARAIRMLVAELERVHSHILWFGALAYQAGVDNLFLECWQERQGVLGLLESLSGKRLAYSPNRIGGVNFDLTPGLSADIRRKIDHLDQRARRYLNFLNRDPLLRKRTHGVGVTTRSQAEKLGLVGPTARGSGVLRDIRVDAPYSGYEAFSPRMVLDHAGDLHARLSVRLKEMVQSIELVRRILAGMPEGAMVVEDFDGGIPPGETISRVEAPCGELFYFIKSSGGDRPARIKIRTPTQSNLASIPALAPGHHLADVPLLLAGVDPYFSFKDSAAVISGPDGPHPAWTWDDLRSFGIAHYGG